MKFYEVLYSWKSYKCLEVFACQVQISVDKSLNNFTGVVFFSSSFHQLDEQQHMRGTI